MVKLFLILIVCAIALGMKPSYADDGFTPAFVLGESGRLTCQQWGEHKKAGGAARDKDVTWLLGFLTGYNLFESRYKRRWFLSQDEKNLTDAVDRYCTDMPRNFVTEAATKFLNRLHPPAKNTQGTSK